MVSQENYIKRLEKILDKQDEFLTHYDVKFEQQNYINKSFFNQIELLKEDLQKHKNLLKDMRKSNIQHKNVINKLKKELEEQLEIQQKLHKDYGEIIQKLTNELEENNNKENIIEENNINEYNDNSNEKIELPPKDFESFYVESTKNVISDIKDKIEEKDKKNKSNEENSEIPNKSKSDNICPSCNSKIDPKFKFCEICGYKLK